LNVIVLCMYVHGKVPPGVCWRQAIFGRLAARPSPPPDAAQRHLTALARRDEEID
jgi:hypothetical protein